MSKRGPKEITPEHKAAMAAGRVEARAVKNYLVALEQTRPKRGRQRTPESVSARLEKIESTIDEVDPVQRLSLVQERIDLEGELKRMGTTIDMTELQRAFVGSAKDYGERKGISYAAWREVGVPAAVLKEAGITRGA